MDVAGSIGLCAGERSSDIGRVLICSGQTSVDAHGVPLHAGDMAAQINQALDNVEAVLRAAGLEMSDVVRLNYYTTDLDAFLSVLNVLGGRLAGSGCRPTTTLLGVARLAYPELLIEIEATAVA
jgi:enamine deaminase RidA (YjgF/YER057c/UK114 family)